MQKGPMLFLLCPYYLIPAKQPISFYNHHILTDIALELDSIRGHTLLYERLFRYLSEFVFLLGCRKSHVSNVRKEAK